MSSTKKLTTIQFIEKCKKIHGNKYDYSLVEYRNNKTKVSIICDKGHLFEMRPNDHLSGQKCGYCSNNKRIPIKDIITLCKNVHGNKYDYSNSTYTGIKDKIEIRCKLHGNFQQSAYSHIKMEQGCPYCGKNKISFNELITKYNTIHNYKYDYSKVIYTKCTDKIEIICPVHGSFFQKATYHQNHGCQKCGNVFRNKTCDFIEKSSLIHDNKYDYSKSVYTTNKNKIDIICPIHGEFNQEANSHMMGKGCPACKESRGEIKIRKILTENNIYFISQYKLENYLYDFYLPNENIIIEYDGIQHFMPIEFFGGENRFNKQATIDKNKTETCNKYNIEILRIGYLDYLNIKDIIINKLKNPTLF